MIELGIPTFGLADLCVVLLAFGPMLLLGVPALLQNVRQPAEVSLVPVAPDPLEPGARRWFDALDDEFSALGFARIDRWRVLGLQDQRARMTAWASPASPAIAVATTLVHETESVKMGSAWLEFQTELADGDSVNTASLRRSRFKRKIARGYVHDAPGVTDPAKLLAQHEKNCAPYLTRGVRHVRAAEFLALFREAWKKDRVHDRALGYWRTLPDGRDGLTLRGAVRMMVDAVSPFSDVGVARLGIVLALGLGLSQLAFGPLAQAVALHTGVYLFEHGLFVGIAAAGVIGLVVPSRAVFLAPVVAWFGLRLGGVDLGSMLSACLFVGGAQLAAGAAANLEAKLRTGL